MNGIGGDLFAIVWDAKTERALAGLNASGRSPVGASALETLVRQGSSSSRSRPSAR